LAAVLPSGEPAPFPRKTVAGDKQTDLPISYNIASSQKVLTIRFKPQIKQRSLDALQWGLIPYWAKDPKIQAPHTK
jgi:putative SOS response-associated peptidase YedK